MKIISHAWSCYKSKLVKIWREQDTPFIGTKIWQKKNGRDLLKSVNRSTLAPTVSTCSGSDHRTSLTTTSIILIMVENRGCDNMRMKDWPIKVLRIHTTNSMDDWDHRACSKLTKLGDVSFYNQSTSEVAQRALRESSEDSNGEREIKALQTKEQRGCVHGVSSMLI
jgi:hypothetical protein